MLRRQPDSEGVQAIVTILRNDRVESYGAAQKLLLWAGGKEHCTMYGGMSQ